MIQTFLGAAVSDAPFISQADLLVKEISQLHQELVPQFFAHLEKSA